MKMCKEDEFFEQRRRVFKYLSVLCSRLVWILSCPTGEFRDKVFTPISRKFGRTSDFRLSATKW